MDPGLQLISASLVVERCPDGVCVADFCLYSPSTKWRQERERDSCIICRVKGRKIEMKRESWLSQKFQLVVVK